jgi:hypothetical protein
MSQDLVQVRNASFSAAARLRADNWRTERFELSNTGVHVSFEYAIDLMIREIKQNGRNNLR